ncbi:hypothetical protein KKF59_03595 [Patescibacteria group bacterium]|nr:hypothetical protein [Patescibacteria group bacterium]MBU1034751.1 hypothetical protein [Patescibacteria group bacterium]MBU1629821.1 hypothetical protein [Patescibacteria group bacterium]MBU1908183.1 hypothetical protein [Patescibacteria group bacterium]
MFIQIDGIDGAGKSTLISAAEDWARGKDLKIFDVTEWSRTRGSAPDLNDIGNVDVLLTSEPTHAGIGAVIRNEIIKRETPYSARFAAESFALDRGVQYTRLILPFLANRAKRLVIQDRGLLSSLAYQPLQSEKENIAGAEPVTIDWLLTLEGNKIALSNHPDIFIFLDIDPKIAADRLAGRTEKIDAHVYEHQAFQARLAERFRDPKVCEPLVERGTQIITLDGSKTKEELKTEMLKILNQTF